MRYQRRRNEPLRARLSIHVQYRDPRAEFGFVRVESRCSRDRRAVGVERQCIESAETMREELLSRYFMTLIPHATLDMGGG